MICYRQIKGGLHEVMVADSDSAGRRRGKCEIIWKKHKKTDLRSIRFQMKKNKIKNILKIGKIR